VVSRDAVAGQLVSRMHCNLDVIFLLGIFTFAFNHFAVAHSSDELAIKQALPCRLKINFICTLPWAHHKEVCSSRCTSEPGIDYCKTSAGKTAVILNFSIFH
jgi:hypothetical protein